MQPDLDDEQGAKGPEENTQEMLADDVLPKVFLDDVFFCRGNEPYHKQTDGGKDEVYPLFVEDIELGVKDFFVLMLKHAEG